MELPKFKKKSNRQTYRTRKLWFTKNDKLYLPKIKTPIKIVLDRPIEGKIKYATVSKTPSGKYFVSFCCEVEEQHLKKTGKEIGLDLGIKHLITTSDGLKYNHPDKLIAKTKRKLKQQQKILSRKTRGSKKYAKRRKRVARLNEKITNQRNWYYHNISTDLIRSYDTIYVEDLNVSGMLKNRRLAAKIYDSAWSILSSMIEYKCHWYEKKFYKIDRWYPSSKTCSSCGSINQDLSLRDRGWTCTDCKSHHDRDQNAAINILKKGQFDLYNKLSSAESVEPSDHEVIVPPSLQKLVTKIERSDIRSVDEGSRIVA